MCFTSSYVSAGSPRRKFLIQNLKEVYLRGTRGDAAYDQGDLFETDRGNGTRKIDGKVGGPVGWTVK